LPIKLVKDRFQLQTGRKILETFVDRFQRPPTFADQS